MKLKFKNKKLTGILTVLPSLEVSFEDDMCEYNYSPLKLAKLKQIMGYNKHRIVRPGTTISDLVVFGLNYLFDKKLLQREEIDALILVTQSPNHFMPPTSNLIQGELGLKEDMICLDINQGCTGFIIGLTQAYMLLDQPSINKIILVNADILSQKVNKKDRNSYPLIGDAACITIVEKSNGNTDIYGIMKMDGSNAYALQIPAGGFKMPSSAQTAIVAEDLNGSFRSLDNLVMKGDDVFSFVQSKVPPLIEEVLAYSETSKDEIDWFLFHQPNKFMLEKLADKLEIDYAKMPSNIVENFGNASGASIPTTLCYNVTDICTESHKVCFAGFGVGLSWSALVQEIGPFNFSEIIYY